ncbi:uncharacterized protein LOC144157655 [Haemaphysalis longicornis]
MILKSLLSADKWRRKYAWIAWASMFCLVGCASCGTPLQEFYQRVRDKSVLLHQCFRNVTNFEDSRSTDVTVCIDGRGQLEGRTNVTMTSRCQGDAEEPKSVFATTVYNADSDSASVVGEDQTVDISMPLPPYNEQAYFFKQRNKATDVVGFKIYDMDESCENAKALAEKICPANSCSLTYVKTNLQATNVD